MIMLGFAWQKGLVPVSAARSTAPSSLNGVEAEANLQAFEIGRIAAYDPAQRGPSARRRRRRRETMPLDELIAHRTGRAHRLPERRLRRPLRRARRRGARRRGAAGRARR